ncbi:MAG TPA: alpha/beta hydrolase [Actinomycetota bacterium]
MAGGHRFLGRSLRSLAGTVAVGRLVTRMDGRRPDPAASDHLGAVRGEPRMIRGPRASRLYTEWFPSTTGRRGTIVFTHGLCLTEAVWHYQKRYLAGNGFAVVTWDLPGHGHSDPIAPAELTQDLLTEALARVVDEYADDTGVIHVGHSLGGVVTLNYLARNPVSAESARGAVLVSTPMQHFANAVAGRWPGAGLEAKALGRVLQFAVESSVVERFLARDVGSSTSGVSYRVIRVGFGRNASPTQIRFIRDVIASVPPKVRAAAYRLLTGYDIRPLLPDIKVPALVMIGKRDRLVDPSESETLASHLPNAKTLVLDDAGHAAFMEVPNRFNEIVRTFAERHLAARRHSA